MLNAQSSAVVDENSRARIDAFKSGKNTKTTKNAKATKATKATKTTKTTKAADLSYDAEAVTRGKSLNTLLDQISDARTRAHELALQIKAQICPNGEYRANATNFTPVVKAFLAEVFLQDTRARKIVDKAKSRLIQIIASTTADALGQTSDADSKRAKRAKRAASHKGGAGQEKPPTSHGSDEDDESTSDENASDTSKTAERKETVKTALRAASTELHELEKLFASLPGNVRKLAQTRAAAIRAMLKAIAANAT